MTPPLSRRRFVQTAAALTLTTAAFGPGALAAAGSGPAPRRRELKKGYMLNAFPGRALPVGRQFELLAAAGFHGVEPRSHLNQDEVLRARDATGLEIPSVTCGTHSRMLAQPNPSAQQAGIDGIQQALRDAKRYGASSILVVPGIVSESITYTENWERTQAGIRACLPLAEELGVKMAIENVWNNFLLSPLEAVRYVDDFKSTAVAFHFDIGNMMYLGWPEQWIRILGPRIAKVHIKEYSRKKMETAGKREGFNVEYLEGDNNWPVIMKALDAIGYRSWAIVEPAYRPAGIEPAVRLRQISERLDRIIAS
jgi:L-ribulose-5-phosphate 3-epimerase